MKYLKISLLFVIFAAMAVLFVSAEEKSSSAGTDASAPAEKLFTATVGTDGVQHVVITGGEYYFEPNHIILKVNVPTEFIVKKTPGAVPHDIVVKAPEAGMDLKIKLETKPRPVTFTPTKTGAYEMYCDQKLLFFKSHKDRGMTGTIEVVP